LRKGVVGEQVFPVLPKESSTGRLGVEIGRTGGKFG